METLKDSIITFFQGNPAFNLFTFILAVFGILFGIYSYFKNRRTKAPTCIVRTIRLITENVKKIDSIEILCAGEKIENLSVSKIAIWNSGKEAIIQNDWATKEPLVIKLDKKYQILDAKILFQKDITNNFSLTIDNDEKSIIINHEYFAFEQGIIIELVHTGKSSHDIAIEGKLKTSTKIVRKKYPVSILPWHSPKKYKKVKKNKKTPLINIGYFLFAAGFVMPFYFSWSILSKANASYLYIIIVITFGCLCGFLYMFVGYRLVKRNIPKGFDVFNEEFFSE